MTNHSRRVRLKTRADNSIPARMWRHKLTRQAIMVKGIVTLTIVASFLDPFWGVGAAVFGNSLWLWMDRD